MPDRQGRQTEEERAQIYRDVYQSRLDKPAPLDPRRALETHYRSAHEVEKLEQKVASLEMTASPPSWVQSWQARVLPARHPARQAIVQQIVNPEG